MILAVTGGTGFVGGRVIDLAIGAGHRVQALTRRPQPERDGVAWIAGALDTPAALGTLVDGADAVIHVAGVVNAPDRAGFAAGNIAGTAAMLAAAGTRRFVHVSSIAAREPALSNYGWSKAEGERLATQSTADWDVVRPPGVYGPGDTEMRDLFRMAQRGLALLPPAGRVSVIHVDDLARLLIALAVTPGQGRVIEADDGVPGGWTHAALFADALGVALGRHVRPIALPRPVLRIGSRIDRLIRGSAAKLTADRVSYLCHPDWTIDPAKRPPAALWQPRIATPDGLRETVEWYRAKGLL